MAAEIAQDRHQRVMAAFCAVCDLDPPARDTFLQSFAEEEPELVEELKALLQADQAEGNAAFASGGGLAAMLARDLTHTFAGAAVAQEAPVPERVGQFTVIRRLGAGGMGVVYEAEQTRPRRRVALKVLHRQLMTDKAAGRFEQEAEALAQIEHPGIPSVFEIEEQDGLHYIAMEMVPGPSLTDYACDHRRPINEVVELVAHIADAVHHAHLRGYVHRDLKPDNVRLGKDGRPRVLDFGIAQALGRQHGGGSQEVAGTLSYMSPEQLDPSEAPDIRTDVYALGCMLYQMLSGRLPHNLRDLSLIDAVRRIQSGAVEPLHRVAPSVPRELSYVVHKALARDRDDRYASAGELAADLRHWRRGEVVNAHPSSTQYRLRKLIGQNRLVFGAGALLLLVMTVAAFVSFGLYQRAEVALQTSVASQKLAETETRKAKATVEFLTKMITEAKPVRSTERELTIRDAVDRASVMLKRQDVAQDDDVKAALHATLAGAYMALSETKEARRQVDAVKTMFEEGAQISPQHHVAALSRSAELYNLEGQVDMALVEIEQAYRIVEAVPDAAQRDLLRVESQHEYARVLRDAGRKDDAVAMFKKALATRRKIAASGGIEKNEVAGTLNQMGHLYAFMGDYEEADRCYQESLSLRTEAYGPEHPQVAITLHNLAWLAMKRKDYEAAHPYLDRSYAIRLQGLGPDHPSLGHQQILRSSIYMAQDRLDEAEAAFDAGIAVMERAYGPDHGRVLENRINKVDLLRRRGRVREAVVLGERLLKQSVGAFGEEHLNTGSCLMAYARALAADGRPRDAIIEAQRAAAAGMSFGAASSLARGAHALVTKLCASGAYPSLCQANAP